MKLPAARLSLDRVSKASFQVNGFGRAKLVRAKEMYHFIVLRPGSLEYFLVDPDHSVKIVSFHDHIIIP